MRHRVDHRTLGRYGSHRMAMLSNMAASLFLHGQVRTTVTRAKELRRVAEKLITRARGGSVHDIRIVFSRMPHHSDDLVYDVHPIFEFCVTVTNIPYFTPFCNQRSRYPSAHSPGLGPVLT